MKIEIIIPNYNGFSLIKKNFPRVLNVILGYKDVAITIVDDGSKKEEVSQLEDYLKETQKDYKFPIKLLKNKKNLGFSSTVNKGAFDSNSDLLVFLNTDVVPEDHFLDSVIESFSKDDKLFGVGCLDKSIEGENIILRGRGVGKWKRGFLIHSRGEVDKENTLWISGGSSIVRRDLFNKLGGFDTLYNPFYWEDIDLSYRAQKLGYNILFDKKSTVIHKHFEGAIKTSQKEFKIKSIAYRNQFIFIWKNITDIKLIFSHILWFPYHFLKALLRLDSPFFYGLLQAKLRLPYIISKRIKQNSSVVRKDIEIINNV